jgi:hypothetical protein
MRARNSTETDSGRRNARETVIGLTLASLATSVIVTFLILKRLFRPVIAMAASRVNHDSVITIFW